MTHPDDGYSFALSVDDFDKSVLPAHARTPGTDEFSHEVSQFFQKEFADFTGQARILVVRVHGPILGDEAVVNRHREQ